MPTWRRLKAIWPEWKSVAEYASYPATSESFSIFLFSKLNWFVIIFFHFHHFPNFSFSKLNRFFIIFFIILSMYRYEMELKIATVWWRTLQLFCHRHLFHHFMLMRPSAANYWYNDADLINHLMSSRWPSFCSAIPTESLKCKIHSNSLKLTPSLSHSNSGTRRSRRTKAHGSATRTAKWWIISRSESWTRPWWCPSLNSLIFLNYLMDGFIVIPW